MPTLHRQGLIMIKKCQQLIRQVKQKEEAPSLVSLCFLLVADYCYDNMSRIVAYCLFLNSRFSKRTKDNPS